MAKRHGGEQNIVAGGQEVPCGINNCLINLKYILPTEEEMETLTPIVLTQEEVPWNPRFSEHNSPVEDSFHKEVLSSAEANVRVKEEAYQILKTRCVDELAAKQK